MAMMVTLRDHLNEETAESVPVCHGVNKNRLAYIRPIVIKGHLLTDISLILFLKFNLYTVLYSGPCGNALLRPLHTFFN